MVKRYKISMIYEDGYRSAINVKEHPEGAYVVAEDYLSLQAERDALVEALDYWLPDESWMMEKYPNHKTEAWGTFYEHAAVLAKAKRSHSYKG